MDTAFELPGYSILEKIGEGGMATIWLARQISLDRIVAIKVLSPQLGRDPEAIERFRLEALAAAKLKHPGIVQVYDAGEHGGLVYIVMEYVAGCTAGELLERKGRLKEKHALLIADGIALALGYAWDTARVIHCDIKPANVLIEQDGAVKLADLGLAKIRGWTNRTADHGVIEGTPHYASPEQAQGEPDLDCRSDIYSLGAMLYHLATGKLPFGESSGLAVMQRQVSDYLPDPRQVNTELSDGLAALVERMMVKDRTLRYQTWSEVCADLEVVKRGGLPGGRILAPGQSTVMRSGAGGEGRRAVRRRAAPVPAEEGSEPGEEEAKIRTKPVAKQRIVLPRDLRKQVREARPRTSADLAHAVFSLLIMAMAVAAGYGALAYLRLSRAQHEELKTEYWENVAAESSAVEPAARPEDARPSAAPSRLAAAAASSAKGNVERVDWHHPRFLKGAELFNDALAKYKEFQATKQNPEVLEVVEQQCRDAIANFESCRKYAPAEVNIQHLIDQCYHLISDCRQSTLVVLAQESESKAKGPVSPIVSRRAEAAAPAAATNQLTLSATWNTYEKGGDRILDDLHDLLVPQGQPAVDLSPDNSLVLFGQIYYLMPVREAGRILGQPLSPRKGVNCPGFPKDSFYSHATEGNFGEGFERLYLVTDAADRVVAVQIVNEHPDESLWLEDPQLFQEKWHTYNFIQMKTKGSAKWRIGQRVQNAGRVIRIDSELVANDEYGYFGLGDSKARVSLFLPQPVVNIILQRLKTLQKT